jgi:hypothetical protein
MLTDQLISHQSQSALQTVHSLIVHTPAACWDDGHISGFPPFRFSRFPPVAVKLKQQDSQSSDCDILRSTH